MMFVRKNFCVPESWKMPGLGNKFRGWIITYVEDIFTCTKIHISDLSEKADSTWDKTR